MGHVGTTEVQNLANKAYKRQLLPSPIHYIKNQPWSD